MRKGFHEPVEKPRRFYADVTVARADDGFNVQLDGRVLRTPQAQRLLLPTAALARLVADEWAAQGELIEMTAMHATRLANTAVETVGTSRQAVADQLAQYAGSDLLCYYAEAPAALVARQDAAWSPVLERARAGEALVFERCTGIIHRDQPAETLARVRGIALSLDDFALAGLAFATPLFGSAVLGIAALRGWLSAEAAFDLSRVEEAFQEEAWGVDAEAAERVERLRDEARMLDGWFRGLDPG